MTTRIYSKDAADRRRNPSRIAVELIGSANLQRQSYRWLRQAGITPWMARSVIFHALLDGKTSRTVHL